MAYSESLAGRLRDALSRRRNVVEKKMFGGVGFLLDGNMCVGVWKDSLIARLGPERAEEALRRPYVSDFDVTGRPMKGWVLVGPEAIDDDQSLSEWVDQAARFARTLPPK
jgi:TfoX/Sxy family transcriptional regulator of competence genes